MHIGWHIKHDSDDSYFGFTDNDTIVFATSNAERVRINSSGNIGIGTSSPNALLHLRQNTIQDTSTTLANQVNIMRFNVNSGTTSSPTYNYGIRLVQLNTPSIGTQLIYYGDSVSGYDNKILTMVSNGNVGIGTTSPLSYAKLHVNGTLFVGENIGASDGTTGACIDFANRDSGDYNTISATSGNYQVLLLERACIIIVALVMPKKINQKCYFS